MKFREYTAYFQHIQGYIQKSEEFGVVRRTEQSRGKIANLESFSSSVHFSFQLYCPYKGPVTMLFIHLGYQSIFVDSRGLQLAGVDGVASLWLYQDPNENVKS